MSPLQANIEATLLPALEGVTAHDKWLNCATQYPWYPLPWLMLASTNNKDSIQKAALWFTDEQRLHCLLHAEAASEDEWLKKSLEAFAVEDDLHDNEAETFILNHEPVDDGGDEQIEEAPPSEAVPIVSEAEQPASAFRKQPDEEPLAVEIAQEAGPEPELVTEVIAETAATHPVVAEIETSKPEPDPAVSEKSASAESFVFEPYHSVDYFASQGIKLQLPKEPIEKFDRQLKSFTQWLKTMKKVAVQEPGSRPADPLVEAQANASVSGKEIITEAMAQVLEKQGKYARAGEIYEKLLLLHPEKSVFFAAQIEELKNKQ